MQCASPGVTQRAPGRPTQEKQQKSVRPGLQAPLHAPSPAAPVFTRRWRGRRPDNWIWRRHATLDEPE
ncbi:hypothetical protein BCEP4_2080018 [Burkholderia cepacia]|nr:hypothetical protein BCEP4_2080018 [Burkholderia cepacia]